MQCEFCEKEFSTKSSLVYHQKTAKYCLEKQGKINEKYKCCHCEKCFTTYQRVIEHQNNSCKLKEKIKYEKDIVSVKEELATCKKQEKIRSKEKEAYYQQQIKEKESYYQQQIKENEAYYLQQIKEKDFYLSTFEEKLKESKDLIKDKIETISKLEANIEKLEARLEKFEDSILSKTDNKPVPQEESIPIPLKEQMSSIIIEDIKEDDTINYSMITLNNVSITSRPIDHYVNATQLCQAGGKKFNDWIRIESTKELIDELSAEAGIPASAFVDTKKGGNNKSDQGSWIHPDLSIQLAQWISPKFAIQVSKWVRTLFNKGSVEIDLNLLREKERDIRIKDHLIKELKAVCLSKQRRIEYPEKNVIYLLTTEDHFKRRTYIIGKAKNLTTRLGTYNKTCDHTVVYYKECKGEDDMDTAETMVLSKLRDYREKANRDRFILPEDKEISFFIGIIDECIRFIG
jgi:hypothetical protein